MFNLYTLSQNQTVIRSLLASILILFSSMAYTETIYKFVDEQGNIQYSADPPPEGANFETLNKMPEPSAAEVKEAKERQKKLEKSVDNAGEPGTGSRQSDSDDVAEGNGGSAVDPDWRARRDEERRRAIWGKDWPIHHPRHK